jgi:hypothetical protein
MNAANRRHVVGIDSDPADGQDCVKQTFALALKRAPTDGAKGSSINK